MIDYPGNCSRSFTQLTRPDLEPGPKGKGPERDSKARPTTLESVRHASPMCSGSRLADVGAALGDGLDEALLAEEGDGAAGRGAGYFPGFDDLGLGWDACSLGVLAGFDA
jgi:hypothetical protein